LAADLPTDAKHLTRLLLWVSEARREFCRELETIRALYLKLLGQKRSPTLADRAVA